MSGYLLRKMAFLGGGGGNTMIFNLRVFDVLVCEIKPYLGQFVFDNN